MTESKDESDKKKQRQHEINSSKFAEKYSKGNINAQYKRIGKMTITEWFHQLRAKDCK